ncbi:MAG: VWA domain-containing protein [Kiritimatiellae bacterium]|nr:VWA domain-containing protein [Kiritimatiellia bacterium]
MTIGAILFLGLLPLAATPVVFHLLVRRNRKTIMFSTHMFFTSMQPHLSFHRKFRERLLLAARTLLLLFLLLALARLAFPGMGSFLGLTGKQAVVVVIDNSSSMVGPVEGADRSKLSVALEGARALLKNMDSDGFGAVVLMVPDPAAARFGGITSDKDTLLSFLESIRATDATGNTAKALQRAMALLKDASSGGGGALHVFSDMQEAEWNVPAAETDDAPENVTVFVHRVPSAEYALPNICPVQAELSSRRILPNQPYALEILLRNDGGQGLDVRLNRKDSEHSVANFVNVEMAANAQRLVKVPVQPKTAGRHWVKVWLEGDAFEGDNQIFVPYVCEEKGDIVFVGDPADNTFGLLPRAFSPAGDGSLTSLVPSYVAPSKLTSRLQQNPLLVVLTWAAAAALDTSTSAVLDQYTQQGGNLLVLPAVDATQAAGKAPSWLAGGQKPLVSLPESVPLRVSGSKSPFWSDLRDLNGRVHIGTAFTEKYIPLSFAQDAGYVALLSAGDGDDLLALRKHGQGQIVLSGLAFGHSRDWSTLPRLRTFLVMTQPIALGAVTTLINGSASIVAGQAPRLVPGEGNDMSIITLLGDQVEWSGPRDQAPLLVRGGAYIVSLGERETSLTVMPSDKEGSAAFIEDDKIPALDRMQSQVSTLSDEDNFRKSLNASLAGTGLCLPFLLLAFIFLLVEGLLSAPPSKWKDSDKDNSDNKTGAARTAGSDVETS